MTDFDCFFRETLLWVRVLCCLSVAFSMVLLRESLLWETWVGAPPPFCVYK